MERKILLTNDGSHTVAVPSMQVTYHSIHGAVQETMHVFIRQGLLEYWKEPPPVVTSIFEMGFGTGLNALCTAMEAITTGNAVMYTTIEAHPLDPQDAALLNYGSLLESEELFAELHRSPWNEEVTLHPAFTLKKIHTDLAGYQGEKNFHMIYFDAFAPAAQPELWTTAIFQKLFALLQPGGLLLTYCSKGAVRRAMQEAGFVVYKIPGPPGKREMVRAMRPV